MRILSDAIRWFLYITTAILIVVATNFTIAGNQTVSVSALWKIILSGFITTLVTLLFYPREVNKKSTVYLQCFVHYLVLCAVMILCGKWFGWIDFTPSGIILMAVSVAAVYLLSFFSHSVTDRRQADAINKRLKEKYSDEIL